MAYNLDTSQFISEVSREDAISIFATNQVHAFYDKVVERYESMKFFYDADKTQDQSKLARFKTLFPKSIIESKDEYEARVRRTRVLPIERSIVNAVGRIYNGHHAVDRRFEIDDDFWTWKVKNFDDSGRSADLFFSEKVFPLRQIGGFCAVVVDWMNDSEGNALTDSEGKLVPYVYILRPSEIINFERVYGTLKWVYTKQKMRTKNRYTVFAHNAIYYIEVENDEDLGKDQSGKYSYELHLAQIDERLQEVPNPVGRVPVSFTIGEPDSDSAFEVGRPARYHLLDMYVAMTEVFYQLNEIGLMYSRPVSIYPENMIKDMQGVATENDEIDMSVIRNSLGQVAVIPNGQDAPSKLFWQADMSGMKALQDYFFTMLESIYRWASIRDKGNVVANNSGVSKSMDTVEERGLLAREADAMEALEREVFGFMFDLRREDFDVEQLKYAKEFDLSTPSDLFKYLSEGGQYGVLNKEMYIYVTREFLRKIGAPQDDIDRVIDEAEGGLNPQISLSELSSFLDEGSEFKKIIVERFSGLNLDKSETNNQTEE